MSPSAPRHARRPRSATVLLPAAAAALLVLAGCGSSSSSYSSSTPTTTATTSSAAATTTSQSAGAVAQTLSVAANPEGQLKFDKSSLSAKAGDVSIAFANMSSIGHNLTVESASGAKVGATPTIQGATQTLKLTLAPGTYKFFCSVPGHRMAGMEGTLTVR